MLIAEAVLIVLIIGVVAIRFFIIRSKLAYLKKLPKAVYDEETMQKKNRNRKRAMRV